MGFTDDDYENIVKNNPEIHKGSLLFPRDKIIRMAGNSIPVKLLEGIFWQIKQIDETVITSYSIHYTKLYEFILTFTRIVASHGKKL